MIKTITATALPALAALAFGATAQAQPGMPVGSRSPHAAMGGPPHGAPGKPHREDMPPPPGMGLSSRDYVKQASAGDLYEMRASELVLQSRKPAIRSFARAMIRDHAVSTDDLRAAAFRSGVRPAPPMLAPDQIGMLRALQRARGIERDRLYLDQQRTAHSEALMLHQNYSRAGESAPLRMAADKIVPVVEHHVDMLRRM